MLSPVKLPAGDRWISAAYTGFVFPLFEPRTSRGLGKRLRHYRGLEGLSLEENKALQWRALARLLQHAYNSTAFYRKRFDIAGVRPYALREASDLEVIPPLTRDDIREHLGELRSSRYGENELTTAATGGTTDTPIPLLRSADSLVEKSAVQWNFNRWAGYLPGSRVFHLWGARQDYIENPSWRWRLYDQRLMRRVWAPTSLFNEAVLESYRQSLNQFRPRIIYAYPTPLALFCEFLRNSDRSYHRPASAICTAEPLLESQRQVIEEVLGCPLFEHYGSREFGMIAAECEYQQGLHLNTGAAYVEYVPIHGSDVEGLHEILVTDLLNYGMPLIRYRIGDCALLGSEACGCGRGYPVIRNVIGRTTDVFRLANGDTVPGVALTNRVLQVCPGLKKTQVIQETFTDFRVRYVPGPSFGSAELELLGANLRRFLPEPVRWTFEQVADIERERSGKTRFCVSHVANRSTMSAKFAAHEQCR